jgi:hypothetical protein
MPKVLSAFSALSFAGITGEVSSHWLKKLVNLWNRKKITQKAHTGRGPETIGEMSAQMAG